MPALRVVSDSIRSRPGRQRPLREASGPAPDPRRTPIGAAVVVALSAILFCEASPAAAGAGAMGQAPGGGVVAQRRLPGTALTLPFPRLGMRWPDTWRQPLAQIARYDWVILGEWDRRVLPKLRSRNPDLIALTSAAARRRHPSTAVAWSPPPVCVLRQPGPQ